MSEQQTQATDDPSGPGWRDVMTGGVTQDGDMVRTYGHWGEARPDETVFDDDVVLEIVKTGVGFYQWRLLRGKPVYRSRKFSSAKEAAESADQVIAAVMRALSQKSIEIHNLTGEEI